MSLRAHAPIPPRAEQSCPAESAPPSVSVGNYVLQEELSQSSFGSLYLARHRHIKTPVAVKLIAPSPTTSASDIERFLRETITISAIRHPNVVGIKDCGVSEDGTAFAIMEYLHGQSLSKRLARGALPMSDALQVAYELSDALACFHSVGVVHGALHPRGIRLVASGHGTVSRAVLANIGVAVDAPSPALGCTQTELHRELYMAPERRLAPQQRTAKQDIYALGCLLYHMITGELPVPGIGAPDIVVDPNTGAPQAVPYELHALISRMMHPNPEQRPASMDELSMELRTLIRAGLVERSASAEHEIPTAIVGDDYRPPQARAPKRKSRVMATCLLFVLGLGIGTAAFVDTGELIAQLGIGEAHATSTASE